MIITKPYILEGMTIKTDSNIQLLEKIRKYDYIYVDFNTLLTTEQNEEFHNFQSNLTEDLIYTEENDYGVERNHHCTIFYGLLPTTDIFRKKLIKQFIRRNIEDFSLIIKGISFFRNDDNFDVMKFEIASDFLTKLHYFIDDNFENENTLKEYQPHMTIAYIKKGTFNDNQWQNYSNFSFCNKSIKVNEIVYQDTYDIKTVMYM